MVDDRDDDGIGYGKPPKNTQFAKGRSGNPRGRRKGSRNLATIVKKTVNDVVPVTENGRRRVITKLEATIKQLANKAASGDPKATQSLLQLLHVIEGKAETPAQTEATDEADRLVMEGFLTRIRNSNNGGSDGNSDAG